MRNFLIRNFVLTKANDIRLGVTNILLFSIAALLITYTGYNFLSVLFAALSLYLLFVTFVYFRIAPVRWHELNGEQKWNYGIAVRDGKTTSKLTTAQKAEWEVLNKRFGK